MARFVFKKNTLCYINMKKYDFYLNILHKNVNWRALRDRCCFKIYFQAYPGPKRIMMYDRKPFKLIIRRTQKHENI